MDKHNVLSLLTICTIFFTTLLIPFSVWSGQFFKRASMQSNGWTNILWVPLIIVSNVLIGLILGTSGCIVFAENMGWPLDENGIDENGNPIFEVAMRIPQVIWLIGFLVGLFQVTKTSSPDR